MTAFDPTSLSPPDPLTITSSPTLKRTTAAESDESVASVEPNIPTRIEERWRFVALALRVGSVEEAVSSVERRAFWVAAKWAMEGGGIAEGARDAEERRVPRP